MAQSANTTTATRNNVVVNPQSATANTADATPKGGEKAPKTRRVFETQADWARLEAQTLALLVALAKGEALPDDARKAFGFGITTDKDGKDTKCPTKGKDAQGNEVTLSWGDTQPHAQNYVLCLALGFASPKATKFLKGTCLESIDRVEIAKAVSLVIYPKAKPEKKLFGTPEITPKRGKWVAEQVLAAFSEAKKSEPKAEATPKGVEAKPKKSAKKSKQTA